MSTYLAGLKGGRFWRAGIILVAFWFSVAFIFVLTKLSPNASLTSIVGGGELSLGGLGGGNTEKLRACGSDGNDASRKSAILKAAERKYGGLMDDKFTIAMSTYKRPKELNHTIFTLTQTKIPSLLEIVVVWNNLGETPPEGFVSEHGVIVRYRASPRNSLNEKLRVDVEPAYKTRAILVSDDDVYYHPSDLEFVFQTWRKFGRNRLTGALARCHDPAKSEKVKGTWEYTFCTRNNQYSMVLTNLAFVDISFMDYYSSADPVMTKIREYVDEHFNCEDIALNYVTSMLTCEGPLLVKGKEKYFNFEPGVGISMKPGHLEARSQCLDDFVGIFGEMMLVNETARVNLAVTID